MAALGARGGAPRNVAIIGGGPAGAQCARRLAEAGVPATLFEPRTAFEKPCGGRGGAGGWRLRTAAAEHGPFDFLVGADGASGAVGRRLAGGPPRGGLTQGIGYYVPGLVEERITLKFYEGINGYLWVFPRADHASAGICGALGERPVAFLRTLMDRWLAERYGPGIPERSERYAALIPGALPGSGQAPLQGDGWAL